MPPIPRARYPQEFKIKAVQMVLEDGVGIAEAARRLSICSKTLTNWVAKTKTEATEFTTKSECSAQEAENARLRKELALLRMECEILKKAAAYFAKGSL